jgi:hypothetical protein
MSTRGAEAAPAAARAPGRRLRRLTLPALLLVAAASCVWAGVARAATVTDIDESYLVGGAGRLVVDSFTVYGAGTATVHLTDLKWPQALSSLSFKLTDAQGQTIGTMMTSAGVASFDLAGAGTYYALAYAREAGSAGSYGSFGLRIDSLTAGASPVPLPAAGWLLGAGLVGFAVFGRRPPSLALRRRALPVWLRAPARAPQRPQTLQRGSPPVRAAPRRRLGWVATLLGLLALGSGSAAHAAAVLVGSPDALLGVNGLTFSVGGTTYTYDVRFEPRKPFNYLLLKDGPPEFLNNAAAAVAAGTALSTLLNLSGVTHIAGLLPTTLTAGTAEIISIPYAYTGGPNPVYEASILRWFSLGNPNWNPRGPERLSAASSYASYAIAVFSASPSAASPVPLPASVWLLLGGVLVLAAFGRGAGRAEPAAA